MASCGMITSLPEFKRGSDDFFAKGGDVVLIRVADLFDETVCSEPFEQARHVAAGEFRQVATERFIL
jgi:hypothetical protein